MDLYDENFKLQDMIDSDMRSVRTELDDYLYEPPGRAPSSPILSGLPVLPLDIMCDSTLDSELSDEGGLGGWMNSSSSYNPMNNSNNSDLDSIGGLLVNPETALPVTVTQLTTTATISMSSAMARGTFSLTLTPKTSGSNGTTSMSGVTLPVQVFAAGLMSDTDVKPSQLNLTVAVPSPNTTKTASRGTQMSRLFPFSKKSHESDISETSKPKSKQKQNSKLTHQLSLESPYPKPAYSYSCLIAMALKNSKTGSLPVNEIYDFMTENFPYFKTAPNGWKNSVRHNLSLNKCFEKIEKPTGAGNGSQRKGYLWALNPAKVEKMEEELQKWGSKDPAAIRKSMANPENLELIEKGELKSSESDIEDEIVPIRVKVEEKKRSRLKARSVESLSGHLSGNFCCPDEAVGMDPSLTELELQNGMWDNLCDDRLQFIHDSPLNSSPKHILALSSTLEDEDSLPTNCPSVLPKSFSRTNYKYSSKKRTSSSSSSSSDFSGDESLIYHSSDTSKRKTVSNKV